MSLFFIGFSIVIDKNSVLILSGFLFLIGLIGILKQSKIVKTFISIEIMIFASILNFCYFSGSTMLKSGHVAAFMAAILSGLTLTIIFTIMAIQLKENETLDILKEQKI